MSDNAFWAALWGAVAAVILGIAGSIVYYNLETNRIWSNRIWSTRIVEAVSKGADPIAAACAIQGYSSTGNQAIVCALAAAQKTK